MKKRHAGNTRIKRDYFDYLKGPKHQNEKSIDIAAKAIARLEDYTQNKDFKTFRKEQAIGFVAHLQRQLAERTGKPLSRATLLSTLRALEAFFTWLSQQQGFKSRFTYLDAEYFALSRKDTAIAQTPSVRPIPSIEQVRHVILSMPSATDIEKRDRALLALAIMTGALADALASLRLKHVDLAANSIQQDARDVRTKFSKTIETTLVPLGDDILVIFRSWVEHLRHDLLWGPEEPLFPKTRIVCGRGRRFEAGGPRTGRLARLRRDPRHLLTSLCSGGGPLSPPPLLSPCADAPCRRTLHHEGGAKSLQPKHWPFVDRDDRDLLRRGSGRAAAGADLEDGKKAGGGRREAGAHARADRNFGGGSHLKALGSTTLNCCRTTVSGTFPRGRSLQTVKFNTWNPRHGVQVCGCRSSAACANSKREKAHVATATWGGADSLEQWPRGAV